MGGRGRGMVGVRRRREGVGWGWGCWRGGRRWDLRNDRLIVLVNFFVDVWLGSRKWSFYFEFCVICLIEL